MLNLKTIFILILALNFSNAALADTIWCKMFNAGCVTDEQRQKQWSYCSQKGDDAYRENLNKALADPTIWQFAGKQSAQDYAMMRERSMFSTCLKMSTPQSF
jgi:hypothetical protein